MTTESESFLRVLMYVSYVVLYMCICLLPATVYEFWIEKCRFVIVGGGNAAGYAARTFVEHGMANGKLCIVSKEVTVISKLLTLLVFLLAIAIDGIIEVGLMRMIAFFPL